MAGFATMVLGFAWLLWKRLARLDKEARGDMLISRRDKRILEMREKPDPWWVR